MAPECNLEPGCQCWEDARGIGTLSIFINWEAHLAGEFPRKIIFVRFWAQWLLSCKAT